MFSFSDITRFRSTPTPFYFYDMGLLEDTLVRLSAAQEERKIKIHYAVKANANLPILRLIRDHGLGADCVSGNEVRRALEAGFSAGDIVFAGVGKTDQEIEYGIRQGISCFNVESLHELSVINEIGRRNGTAVPVAFRINPDVDGGTHRHITTGTRLDKFGMAEEDIPELLASLRSMHNIRFVGLHFHIGSQITDMEIFSSLAARINSIQDAFASGGHRPGIINVGGGLGIDYEEPDRARIPDFNAYFDAYMDNLRTTPGQEVHFELGRSVVGQCGSLVTRVLYLKDNGGSSFAIVDAGMNDLIRPALYGASHKIQSLSGPGKEKAYQVAGPICESSDVFGRNVNLPELKRGDLIAIRSAGAYGETMASGYNLRAPARAIYSGNSKEARISPRLASDF